MLALFAIAACARAYVAAQRSVFTAGPSALTVNADPPFKGEISEIRNVSQTVLEIRCRSADLPFVQTPPAVPDAFGVIENYEITMLRIVCVGRGFAWDTPERVLCAYECDNAAIPVGDVPEIGEHCEQSQFLNYAQDCVVLFQGSTQLDCWSVVTYAADVFAARAAGDDLVLGFIWDPDACYAGGAIRTNAKN